MNIILKNQTEHTEISQQGFHDLRNQVNQCFQCCKNLKNGQVEEQSEEEKKQMYDEMYLTIKYVTKRLQQLYCIELIYNISQNVKPESKKQDDLIQEIFKRSQVFALNKNITIESNIPEGYYQQIYEDAHLLTILFVYIWNKLTDSGFRDFKIQNSFKNKSCQEMKFKFEDSLQISDYKQLENHINNQKIYRLMKNLLINTKIQMKLTENTILFEFNINNSDLEYDYKIHKNINFLIQDNSFETNYTKPNLNSIKNKISCNILKFISNKSQTDEYIDERKSVINKFVSNFSSVKKDKIEFLNNSNHSINSGRLSRYSRNSKNSKISIKNSYKLKASSYSKDDYEKSVENQFKSNTDENNLLANNINDNNLICNNQIIEKTSTRICSFNTISVEDIESNKKVTKNLTIDYNDDEKKLHFNKKATVDFNNSICPEEIDTNDQIADKQLNKNSDFQNDITIDLKDVNIDKFDKPASKFQKESSRWKSTPEVFIDVIAHKCSQIINIDDESCILNMNKSLFKRKLKIDINICRDSKELNLICQSIASCNICSKKNIILISDYMLENEQGSDVVRNIIDKFSNLKLICYGLTSSEDIQVKNEFMSAGIKKLQIKPLKVKTITEIINDSNQLNN